MRQETVPPAAPTAEPAAFAPVGAPPKQARDKALRLLAKTLYRQLRTQGYEAREMVTLSTELLSLVTLEIRDPEMEEEEEEEE